MIRYRFVGLQTILLLAGCASVSPMQVGQMAGGIAGSAIAPGPGTQLGALIGTMAGMLVQGHIEKKQEDSERQTLTRDLRAPSGAAGGETTMASLGTPTRVWVDEQMADGRLIAGHFEERAIP